MWCSSNGPKEHPELLQSSQGARAACPILRMDSSKLYGELGLGFQGFGVFTVVTEQPPQVLGLYWSKSSPETNSTAWQDWYHYCRKFKEFGDDRPFPPYLGAFHTCSVWSSVGGFAELGTCFGLRILFMKTVIWSECDLQNSSAVRGIASSR